MINQTRKATKGCLTIMKDKINSQFDKRKSFDMSFGLGKEKGDDSEEEDEENSPVIAANKQESIAKMEKNKFKEY